MAFTPLEEDTWRLGSDLSNYSFSLVSFVEVMIQDVKLSRSVEILVNVKRDCV